MKYSVHSIYRATEGEGIHLGRPQIFVRFQGCNIGCVNCDSKETWEFIDETLTLNEVIEAIIIQGHQGKIKNVSITGGDPLHPKHAPSVIELVRELKSLGYYINIEAAGTRVIDEIFDLVDFVSFDYKTPSTGVKTNEKLLAKLCEQYSGKAQIKSVIENERDFDDTYKTFMSLDTDIPWVLTPAYNENEKFPKERFLNVIELNEKTGGLFRVIGQQHKWFHGPDNLEV